MESIVTIGLIIVGLANIICGISAIVFNKYPGRKRGLKQIQKEYGDVCEKKLYKLEGCKFIVLGIMWIGLFIMNIKRSVILGVIISCICIALVPIYYITRYKIFSKK